MNNEQKIGEPDPDKGGWFFMGKSPDDGEPFWIALQDTPREINLYRAKAYAKSLQETFNTAGKHGCLWVPSIAELDQVCRFVRENKESALAKTFEINSCYWSSSNINEDYAFNLRFPDGSTHRDIQSISLAVRCVRR